jgi:hypothetical protein
MPDSNPSEMSDSNPSEMSDSNPSEDLAAKGERNRQERIDGIKRWVEYIREHPPEVWGTQQNRVVNAQLESAREAGLSPEHIRRVRAFGEAASEAEDDS